MIATNGTEAQTGRKHQPRGAYEEAAVGFREYWYPVCMSGEITETPKPFTFLGDPVVMLKRDGEIYALKDECPHRGTALSLVNTRKNLEFPGTPTITCAYHGWTYDVRDGKCVAVISEGPDSPVPDANIRAKTYPIEVRRGIVWIWMGNGKPVPVEDDIPNLLLDDKAVVHGFYRVKEGSWRFHAENVAAGHAGMVHKSTLRSWFGPNPGTPTLPPDSGYAEDHDGRGISASVLRNADPAASTDPKFTPVFTLPPNTHKEFPGLGVWYNRPKWQRTFFGWVPKPGNYFRQPVQGVRSMMLMLPGLFRVPNFPNKGYMYYEWYVPVDDLHYIYMQIMAFWPKNKVDRLRWELKYFFWDRPTGPVLFNNQDAAMVKATTKYYTRTGNMRYLTKISKNDEIDWKWREFCDEFARGVGTAFKKRSIEDEAVAIIDDVPAEAAVAGGGAGGD